MKQTTSPIPESNFTYFSPNKSIPKEELSNMKKYKENQNWENIFYETAENYGKYKNHKFI